jgi:hypothetical protein
MASHVEMEVVAKHEYTVCLSESINIGYIQWRSQEFIFGWAAENL